MGETFLRHFWRVIYVMFKLYKMLENPQKEELFIIADINVGEQGRSMKTLYNMINLYIFDLFEVLWNMNMNWLYVFIINP